MKTARRILVAFGTLLILYALSGALTDPDLKGGALIFLVAVLVLHDGLLLPLSIGAGFLIGRIVPSPLRTPVRVAGVIGLALTVVALPLVLGRGRVADNPSILPLDYGRGLLIAYGIIAVTTALLAFVRRWRRGPVTR